MSNQTQQSVEDYLTDSERKNLCPIQQVELITRRKEMEMRSRSFPSNLPIEFYLSACKESNVKIDERVMMEDMEDWDD